MSVKILVDCIFTADPSRCSSFVQMATFMKLVLAQRQDVYFYVTLPKWDFDDEERAWLPKHPNIKYIPVTQHKDRTKEYFTLSTEMDQIVAFNGDYWDYDILLTTRTTTIPLYKLIMTSPKQVGIRYLREVWLIEEMSLMDFKTSVMKVNPPVQDIAVLAGYMAADRIMTVSYHEKAASLATARRLLSPSTVMDLSGKIKETIPAQLTGDVSLKKPEHFYTPKSGKPFTLAYAGRLMASGTRLDSIYEAMTKSWIIRGENNVRLVVCTNSVGGVPRAQPKEHMEKYLAPREEFWRMAREEMHLLMIMHEDGGFSLSMMEPMMLGTPALVAREPWSMGVLGPDYPFYVKNEFELFAFAKLFYEDYATQYKKFEAWLEDWFKPTYAKRFKEDSLYNVLQGYLVEYEKTALPKFVKEAPNREDNFVVHELVKGDPKEIDIIPDLKRIGETGVLRSLDKHLDGGDRDKRWLAYATPFGHFRHVLKAFYGYEDASVRVGHMRKKDDAPKPKKGKKK